MGNAGNEKMNQNNSGHASATMRHGTPYKNIIRKFIRDGREWQLHATKGWRSRRV